MRRRGKRELAALLTVALLAGSAACGADAGEKDAATGTAEAAAGQDTETAAGQGTDAQAGAQENLEETALSLMREVNPAEAAGTDDLYRSWYEVFVYSFYDGDGDGIGDLPGLTEKLDYINDGNPATDTDLGCDGIWLMPVMPATTYHKYDVTDYCAIDEQYGTMEDFETFVNACHERGIRVMIDFVMNHTSSQHPWFQTAAEYLNGTRYLAVTPDNTVELALARLFREVGAVEGEIFALLTALFAPSALGAHAAVLSAIIRSVLAALARAQRCRKVGEWRKQLSEINGGRVTVISVVVPVSVRILTVLAGHFRAVAVATVAGDKLLHLGIHAVEVLIREPHLLYHVFDRLYPELLCAAQTDALIYRLFSVKAGDENHRHALFTSRTKFHFHMMLLIYVAEKPFFISSPRKLTQLLLRGTSLTARRAASEETRGKCKQMRGIERLTEQIGTKRNDGRTHNGQHPRKRIAETEPGKRAERAARELIYPVQHRQAEHRLEHCGNDAHSDKREQKAAEKGDAFTDS